MVNINLSGDFSMDQLKSYGEYLEEQIESLSEINEVDIRGVMDKEVAIAMDVLGRDSDFDVGKDSIVRVHRYRLKLLKEGKWSLADEKGKAISTLYPDHPLPVPAPRPGPPAGFSRAGWARPLRSRHNGLPPSCRILLH